MKKYILIALVAVSLLACKQEGYKISGEITNPKLDSMQLILSERVNRKWINLDSAIIQNGKFEFQGKADSAKVGYLKVTDKEGEEYVESFILENGNIQVKIDSAGNMSITGTKENDVLNEYKAVKRNIAQKSEDLYNKTKAANPQRWEAVKDSVNSLLAVIDAEGVKTDLDYSTKYVNTLAGSYVFMNSFYEFTVQDKEKLFSLMDDKTKSIPRISELIAATEVEKKTSAGQPYVDFSMTAPDGKTVKLSEYVGKTDYLLVDFWASWCPDCVASFPELTSFYQKNKGTKFDIVGVSLDDETQRWTNGIEKHKLAWHHMSDLQKWNSQGAKLYAVNAIPATVLIDKTGKIVGRNLELKEIQDLLNQIVTK